MQKLENDFSGRIIIKLMAEFECTMYDFQGNAEKLTDGIFIGLFSQKNYAIEIENELKRIINSSIDPPADLGL